MLFNSVEFLLFAPIVLLVHAALKGWYSKLFTVIVSYIFYGWAEPWYCILLFGSTVLDFQIGRALGRIRGARQRQILLAGSVFGNLGVLVVFKYSGFVIRSLNDLFSANLGFMLPVWEPVLPIGISFYTFQTLSYTIDVYRKKVTPTESFLTFALYVAFFPQLVAGPIERAGHLLKQLETKIRRTADDILCGITRIFWGLTKKIIFADLLAGYVDAVYAAPEYATPFELVVATYAFAFQIYLDFSAYSDIAIGLARVMGIRFQENFQWPYLARNISEFWGKWHISLSTWLRDYLYVPLGGSRKGAGKTVINVMVVMVLGGLWHGANWTFVVWGAWIGAALGIYHIYRWIVGPASDRVRPSNFQDWLGVGITFHVMLISWVFFRSDSLGVVSDIFLKVAGTWDTDYTNVTTPMMNVFAIWAIGITGCFHLFRGLGGTKKLETIRSPFVIGIFWAMLVQAMVVFHAPVGAKFIYFQF